MAPLELRLPLFFRLVCLLTAGVLLAPVDELLDLRIGLSSASWSITLFAKNLTDERYLEEVITAPEFGGSFIHPGSERRVGVELGYRF